MKFTFNEDKALAALAYVASLEQGLTPLFVAKILFFAEKAHINQFGRPILGDTFIAMPRGPVPSTVKNYVDEKWEWVGKPENFDRFVRIERWGLRRLSAGPEPADETVLSESDKRCLREAVAFCHGKTANQLSDLTHFEKSWLNAPSNRPMSYEDFVDETNPHREEVLEMMRENAAYGVL